MKKNFYTWILPLLISACNSVHTEGEKNVRLEDDTVAKVHVEVSGEETRKQMNSKLLFEAHGTEPGWFAQLYANRLRLVVDYGEDSVIVEDSFENIASKPDYAYNKVIDGNKLELNIKNNSCIDEGSGDKLPKEVIVSWKNKSYRGCGKPLN